MKFKDQEELVALLTQGIELGQFPNTLYQFKPLTKYTENIFQNDEIFFSSITNFNDPFEGKFIHDVDYKDYEVYLYLLGLKYQKHNIDIDINILYNAVINDRITFNKNNLTTINNLLENSGVGCFVTNYNNLLMWSHYANSHKGVCIEYEILKSPETFVSPIPVEYSNKYPKLNYIRNQHDLLEKTICRKSTEWSYEDEFRILKPKNGVYKIKKESIRSISFGVKCSENDRIELVKILKNNNYNHVKLYQCLLSQRSFELERKDVTVDLFSKV
ncbi:DUF2971 domain-containing protein [Myroides sp. WP-1]|uniref:DUF2971 domain-containing protein n=1 Tax=Myroides sp. WP-1 TaxID=2759944 RepID=UPI0015F79529|nr:DUF2971 domain-containing protein [Myroides sp. WP-1]MBB1139177.1 DUF2971 domain-containing protein [Myroides sp. WP-1]